MALNMIILQILHKFNPFYFNKTYLYDNYCNQDSNGFVANQSILTSLIETSFIKTCFVKSILSNINVYGFLFMTVFISLSLNFAQQTDHLIKGVVLQ